MRAVFDSFDPTSGSAVPAKIKRPKNKKRRRIILASALVALAALSVCALYSGLVVRKYEIESAKMPSGTAVRIVLIADLHSQLYGSDQKELLDKIKEQKPDIIALAGDIVDYHLPPEGAQLLLQDIAGIAPVYYVTGNNEFWSGKCDEIKKMMEGYGITVLNNESAHMIINGTAICICGVDDPEIFKYTDDEQLLDEKDVQGVMKRFSGLDDNYVNILIAHRPEQIDLYRQYDFDLVLAGHTHGGQVRIPPFINGLYTPDQGLFPKYAGGLYEFEDMSMVVSRGLSLDKLVPRIFDPPEVVVIEIKGKTKEAVHGNQKDIFEIVRLNL